MPCLDAKGPNEGSVYQVKVNSAIKDHEKTTHVVLKTFTGGCIDAERTSLLRHAPHGSARRTFRGRIEAKPRHVISKCVAWWERKQEREIIHSLFVILAAG